MGKDYKEAGKWLLRAAEQGDADAQYQLGLMYGVRTPSGEGGGFYLWARSEGGEQQGRQLIEASKWYRLAAEQGHVAAQLALGKLYRQGVGVPRDDVEAFKWLLRAASASVEGPRKERQAARNALGSMYQAGASVPVDYVQAFMWYMLAGNPASMAGISSYMTPEMLEKAHRLAREWKPKTETP